MNKRLLAFALTCCLLATGCGKDTETSGTGDNNNTSSSVSDTSGASAGDNAGSSTGGTQIEGGENSTQTNTGTSPIFVDVMQDNGVSRVSLESELPEVKDYFYEGNLYQYDGTTLMSHTMSKDAAATESYKTFMANVLPMVEGDAAAFIDLVNKLDADGSKEELDSDGNLIAEIDGRIVANREDDVSHRLSFCYVGKDNVEVEIDVARFAVGTYSVAISKNYDYHDVTSFVSNLYDLEMLLFGEVVTAGVEQYESVGAYKPDGTADFTKLECFDLYTKLATTDMLSKLTTAIQTDVLNKGSVPAILGSEYCIDDEYFRVALADDEYGCSIHLISIPRPINSTASLHDGAKPVQINFFTPEHIEDLTVGDVEFAYTYGNYFILIEKEDNGYDLTITDDTNCAPQLRYVYEGVTFDRVLELISGIEFVPTESTAIPTGIVHYLYVEDITVGDWIFGIPNMKNNRFAVARDYIGTDTEATVPTEVGGIPVKFVHFGATHQPEDNTTLTKLNIPSNISIYDSFFDYYTALETIVCDGSPYITSIRTYNPDFTPTMVVSPDAKYILDVSGFKIQVGDKVYDTFEDYKNAN